MNESNDDLYGVVLDNPEGPSYWIGKSGGDGPGWCISPSKQGRLKIPKHDAERILDRLPMVAAMKIERGWKASVVRIGGRKRRAREQGRRDRDPSPQAVSVSSTPRSPLDLLRQLEAMRVCAAELVAELDIDTGEGYFAGDVYSELSRLVGVGNQLLKQA